MELDAERRDGLDEDEDDRGDDQRVEEHDAHRRRLDPEECDVPVDQAVGAVRIRGL